MFFLCKIKLKLESNVVVLLERFYLHNRSHQRISFTNSKVSTSFQGPSFSQVVVKNDNVLILIAICFFIISKELFASSEKNVQSSATNVESQSVKTKGLFNKKDNNFL